MVWTDDDLIVFFRRYVIVACLAASRSRESGKWKMEEDGRSVEWSNGRMGREWNRACGTSPRCPPSPKKEKREDGRENEAMKMEMKMIVAVRR